MAVIIGLPDGGAGIEFTDHPAHHRDGKVTVTWSAETLAAMVEAAQRALATDKYVTVERPDDAD